MCKCQFDNNLFFVDRFVFEDVMLSDPMMGDCTNDTLSFFNLDPPSTATVPAQLCGMLSGQESKKQINAKKTICRGCPRKNVLIMRNLVWEFRLVVW